MELRVNDYVRERGEILKIEILVKDYEGGVLIKFKEYAGSNVFKLKEIEKWKHSPNIIDLIEVGDYVNEQKMKEFYVEENPVTKNKRLVIKHEWLKIINDFEIKSIVTHEQFNSIKYEVI